MRKIAACIVVAVIGVACGGGGTEGVGTSSPSPAGAQFPPNTVFVSNNQFAPRDITVTRGTTVTWINRGGTLAHNIVSLDELFTSHPGCTGDQVTTNHTGCMRVGEEFRFAFSKPGEFVYYCPIHSICDMKLCTGMRGRVTVL